MDRAETTLFMLMSVDGKISTGSTDDCDFDTDFPKIENLKNGLYQYYDIEKTTDLWSLTSGRIQSKLGVNTKNYKCICEKSDLSFVIVDNTHLTSSGIEYFCTLLKNVVLVTSNINHIAFKLNSSNFNNLRVIYQEQLNLKEILEILKNEHNCDNITIQTGGILNSLFLREKLLDNIDIVVAPILVGGKDTSTLIDGQSLISNTELSKLGILELKDCEILDNSYIRLKYRVIYKNN